MGIVKEQGNSRENKEKKGEDKGIDEIENETPFLSLFWFALVTMLFFH